ncbi:MAG: mucoidy inhibitor MuiA family protein [Planctomycetota bacterium]|nr:mucoidy inhibitor MuiA family protein [Planctomycetota bacterium]
MIHSTHGALSVCLSKEESMRKLCLSYCLSFFLFFLSLTGHLKAEDGTEPAGRPFETRIDRVLVFSTQAIIARVGELAFEKDKERLIIQGLPAGLIDDSVRVRLEGPAEPRMVNLEVILVHKSMFLKKEAQQASDELDKLLQDAQVLNDRMAELKEQSGFYKSFQVGALPKGKQESEEPAPIHIAAWGAALDAVKEGMTQLANEKLKLEEGLDVLNSKIAVARARANRLLSYETKSTKNVALEVKGIDGQKMKAEVSYRIHGPQWFPRYSVRADLKTEQMEVVKDALVKQQTGEDWDDALLEFSAAEPSQSADLPQLMAWHIGAAGTRGSVERFARASGTLRVPTAPVQPRQPRAQRRPLYESRLVQEKLTKAVRGTLSESMPHSGRLRSKGRRERAVEGKLKKVEELYKRQEVALQRGDVASNWRLNSRIVQQYGKDQDVRKAYGNLINAAGANIKRAVRLLHARKLAVGVVSPVLSSRGYDYKYRASKRESIPSDGVFSKVTLGAKSDKAEFIYEIVPELARRAYLFGTMKNPFGSPLLAGPTGVFLGNDFVTQGLVKTTSSGEELRIGLGVDEGIVVSRTMAIKRDTVGWSGSRYSFRHEVEIQIRNNKKREVRMTVFDRVPYSSRKEVKIKVDRLSPAPSEEKKNGLEQWSFTLGGGEEKNISMAYVVTHSSKFRVVLDGGMANANPDAGDPQRDAQPIRR